ncbi:MAG TPA: lyase family protein, partial [Solirubrobacteraceae bacterium]|nr:lyase family protein [Solirubrobacteraceae bacterium]
MIARYTRPEIGALWTDEARMEAWRRVEVAACEAMEEPTEAELEAIRAATFTVEAVQEREAITDHDVAAFVDVLSASAGDAGRWIHFGLTSSDVLDTALALQLRAAGEVVLRGARELAEALVARAREHVATVCVGRTHGVHAEPTTFGVKLAGLAMEARRNVARLERAFAQASVGAVSGAVGTYASTSPDFELRVLEKLGLQREPVST